MPDGLSALAAQVRQCRICEDTPRGRPLPHPPRPVLVPSSTARILIAGQAPGTRVHASGVPFDDRSGDRLRDWMGVDRTTFYDARRVAMLPMGFCFPGLDASGSDLPPRRECAPAWRERLVAAMPQVDLVLVIGRYAQDWHLGADGGRGVDERVRGWRQIFERPGPRRHLPLPHPSWRNTAWLRRNPWFEAELLPVLRSEIAERL